MLRAEGLLYAAKLLPNHPRHPHRRMRIQNLFNLTRKNILPADEAGSCFLGGKMISFEIMKKFLLPLMYGSS